MEKETNLTPEVKEFKWSLMAIDHLQKTAPWIKFFSILGFIGSGIMILVAVSFLFVSIPTTFSPIPFGNGLAFISPFYVVIAILTFLPSLFLLKYSNKISEIRYADNSDATIEDAFLWQKKYWKLIGIFMIIYLGFIVLAITGVLIAVFALKAF